MRQRIIGWDIGGAHVKAVALDRSGGVEDVALYPCPLWKGMDHLKQAVLAVINRFQCEDATHAVTMTGELVDLFENREDGVRRIIDAMRQELPAAELRIYAGLRGFVAAEALSAENCLAIASMNWLASATLAARRVDEGLFVDIGSTTTDILYFAGGKVHANGMTDYERMVSGELVYTGIVRTAVMALTRRAVFNGRSMGLMAEYFATMADVYRITGDLNEAHDQSDSADGGAKTQVGSARRLARMTGFDFDESNWPLWRDFADHLKGVQKTQIAEACLELLSARQNTEKVKWIGAGIGRFLVREIADEAGYIYQDFNELCGQPAKSTEVDASDCAPAAAVALLFFGRGKPLTRSGVK